MRKKKKRKLQPPNPSVHGVKLYCGIISYGYRYININCKQPSNIYIVVGEMSYPLINH